MAKKGQNLRIFIGGKCVAVSTSCSFHVALQLEEASTKDDMQGWQNQECVGKSWDCSCDALYDPEAATETNAITPAELMAMIIEQDDPKVTLKWDATEGDKNRTGKNKGYTGQAYLNDASVSAGNRQNVTGSFQFTGAGELTAIA